MNKGFSHIVVIAIIGVLLTGIIFLISSSVVLSPIETTTNTLPIVQKTVDKVKEKINIEHNILESITAGGVEYYINSQNKLISKNLTTQVEKEIVLQNQQEYLTQLYINENTNNLVVITGNVADGGNKVRLIIYNLDNVSEKYIDVEDVANISVHSFSPDNKYIVLLTSTCPCDVEYLIYDTNTLQKLADITAGQFLWSPDSSKIAVSKQNEDYYLNFIDSANSSTYIYNLSDFNNPNLLLSADKFTSYIPKEWKNKNTLLVSKWKYEEPLIAESVNNPQIEEITAPIN